MEPIIDIKLLETDEGKVPFEQWYDSIRDKVTKVRVRRRLDRVSLGNFGDTESVGEGVYELRLHFGAGYRVYFARIGNTVIVLIGGGDKSSQKKDITEAKKLWREYKDEAQKYARKLEQ
ncbi:type II toxin-antitoxin system RelE/ParE family toxin [Crocosphaera sp.]|uniref:type II toxin-antitoxin system RelE/ParE family toxin n=1 Tax=Crocosphaera sp. TaxID=2729996 RepID=UPI003F235AB5|nr:type II toxin-antitoxin system RelE/ParE family toxin [Crocosphaera sp.]